MLGKREPELYGTFTLEEICTRLNERATSLGHVVTFFQSNHEGELVDFIHKAYQNCELLLINGAAYSHTSIALRDALAMLDCVKIEVHLSNIHAREAFRQTSMIAAVCDGVIAGLGAESYYLALEGGLKMAMLRYDG
jgi:3-dehydroquinate dehydratase-2